MADVPADFPRTEHLGCVAGAHPKLLVQQREAVFVAPDGETYEARHLVCEDLVRQLLAYAARKRLERPEWTPEQVRDKVVSSTRQKAFGWGLSPAEAQWVLKRFKSLDQP